MKKKVKIGKKTLTLESNAATPIFYRTTFKRDYFSDLANMSADKMDVEFVYRLTYIMSGARKEGVDYTEWLEGFELNDIIEAIDGISQMIIGNNSTIEEADEDEKKQEAVES